MFLALLSIQEALEKNVDTSKTISSNWDVVWDSFFDFSGGGSISGQLLFSQVSNFGLMVASFSIVFLVIQLIQAGKDRHYEQFFLNLMVPAVVSLFLANNGQLTASTCFLLRNFINELNYQISSSILMGVDLQESFQKLIQGSAARLIIANSLQSCEVLIGEAQLECLRSTATELRLELLAQSAGDGGGSGVFEVMGDFLTDFVADPEAGIERLMLPLVESFVAGILGDLMLGYQQLLEISLFVTAIIAPLAVGASMLPMQPRAIFAWATGFFSVGLAKICFNLACGLAAVTALNDSKVTISTLEDSTYLFTLFGLLAPLFSASMATLGGMAVWQGLTGVSLKVASTATRFVSRGLF